MHYQSAVRMISFAQVWAVQWSDTIPSQNVQFQVRIDLTLFHFNTPTELNYSKIIQFWTWIVPLWWLARTWWTDWLDYQFQQHGKVLWPYFHTVPECNDVEYQCVWFDVWLLDLLWGILQLGCPSIVVLVLWWGTLFLCWRIWAMQLVIQCWLVPYIQLLPLKMQPFFVAEMPKILHHWPSGKCVLMWSDGNLYFHPNLSLSIWLTQHLNFHHIWFWFLLCLWDIKVHIWHTWCVPVLGCYYIMIISLLQMQYWV